MRTILLPLLMMGATFTHGGEDCIYVTAVQKEVAALADYAALSDRTWGLRTWDLINRAAPTGNLQDCLQQCGVPEVVYCEKVLLWLQHRRGKSIPVLLPKKSR